MSGVSSAIQTQLNNKQATGNYITSLTGDVTASGPGAAAATIANDAVTFAKIQNITTDRLLGRDTAGSADAEEITVGGGLEFTGTTGIQRSALTGDVTATAGSNATTIASSAVTNAKMANMVQATIKGRAATAGTGAPTDLTATEATAILNTFGADSGSGGLKGLVPATAAGDATKFLRGDATWAEASGGTGKNYILNPNAEINTTGWVTYQDGAGTAPVDGTGGSPTVTWTRSTSTPLRGAASFLLTKDAANRQGEGVTYIFAIDPVDSYGRMMNVTFDYSVASGTYASGDVTIWLMNDLNNTVMQMPSANSIIASGGPTQHLQTTFQTEYGYTSYRLLFHVSSTSASAYTLKFDNISVGPQSIATGTPVTDWVAYTPTGAWSSNTTYTGFWRRVGDTLDLDLKVAVTGAPTSASLTVNLPSGLVIDTAKITDVNAAIAAWTSTVNIRDAGTDNFEGTVRYNSTTSIAILKDDGDGTVSAVTQAAPMTFANGDFVSIKVSGIAVSGWSSSTVMSTSADNRMVVFTGTQSSQAVTANVTNLTLTSTKDTHGGWATNIYTVSVPGDYLVAGSHVTSGGTAIMAYKNGSFFAWGNNAPSASSKGVISVLIPNCVVGDTISIRFDSSVTITAGNISISKLQNSQQIAATESINARYFASATSISGSLATVVWTTKDYDSHTAMSSGVYTVPAPGKYFIEEANAISGTFALNSTSIVEVQKNGTAVCSKTNYAGGIITNSDIAITCNVNAVTGDTIRVQVSSSATGPAIVSSNSRNWISVTRTGN